MPDAQRPPLTPADCDLQDFEFMPVMVRRLLKSETWALGNGDERAAAVALWFESWHQVPAASLPSDERLLARLADTPKWAKVRVQALRGWLDCTDGRLYHPVVAEKALEAWIEKLINSISGAAGNAKRWQIAIDTSIDVHRLRIAAEMLRALDPKSKALRKKAVLSILAGSPPDVPEPSPPDIGDDSPPDRKGQGQGQGQGSPNPPAPPPPTPTPTPPASPSAQRALRKCPEAFEVTADMVAWANEHLPAINPERLQLETDKFRDHTFTNAKTDWASTWRNWMRRVAEKLAENSSPERPLSHAAQAVAKHLPGIAAGNAPRSRSFATAMNQEALDVTPKPSRS